MVEDEFGSGLLCSGASEEQCPIQCLWCVELKSCVARIGECEVQPSERWSSTFLLVLFAATLIGMIMFSRRQPQGAAHQPHGQDRTEDYHCTNRSLHAHHSSLALSSEPEVQMPEGQRLLTGDRDHRD